MKNGNKAQKTAFRLLYVYSTQSLKKLQLIKFFYALKGRNNNPGILQRTNSEFLAKGIIDTSIENKEDLEEFFKFWDVSYEVYKYKETSKKPNYAIFKYSSSHFSKKDKVKFHYALKGRNKNLGLIERTNSKFLAKSVLLVPISQAKDVEDFFSVWSCEFEKKEVMING